MHDCGDLPERIRSTCAALPGAEPYLMHGHPSFRVGKKCFLIGRDDPRDPGISVKVPVFDQPLYLEDPRVSRMPYIGQHGWISLDLRQGFRWEEVAALILISYRLAATKKRLAELDSRRPL